MGVQTHPSVGDEQVGDLVFLVPPVDLSESNTYLSGGRDFCDIPHFGEAYGYADFNSATAKNVSSIHFTPVPEPSIYAPGGVAFLALALWKRHRQTISQTA